VFQQTSSERSQRGGGSTALDEQTTDPFWSTSFSDVPPPSACSTFTEDPTATGAAPRHPDQPAAATPSSSSLSDLAASTTVTVDSRDMAFVLTESTDALSSPTAGLSTQCDDDRDSKEHVNAEELAAATDTHQHVNDDDNDDDVRQIICVLYVEHSLVQTLSASVPLTSMLYCLVCCRTVLHDVNK